MIESVPDYSAHTEAAASDGTIGSELIAAVDKVTRIDNEIERAEARLKDLNAHRRRLVEHEIPDIMARAGSDEMKLSSIGCKVVVKDEIRASLPKDERRPLAFAWLEDTGNGGLIDRMFKIRFPREDEAWADKFERDLAKCKRPLEVERIKDVHHQRLLGFLREQLRNGKLPPLDLFGGFIQRIATIKSVR